LILAIREKYDNKINMIEKELANVQKCLQYDTSLVPERVEHSKLKRPTDVQPTGSRVQNISTDTSPVPEREEHCRLKKPTSAAPTNGSRSQNTSTDTSPVPEREEHCKLKKPRGQNTSTDQTRRIFRDAKLELGQILQSQVWERSPREQRMTEAAFLTIGSRSRIREKSLGKSKNQTVAQPTGSRSVSTDPTGSKRVSTDPTGSRRVSTNPTGSRSVSTDHTGSSSTDQTGCGGQNPSTNHMRRLLQNAKLDLVQMLQRSTSAP
jgi:hypothetical protein